MRTIVLLLNVVPVAGCSSGDIRTYSVQGKVVYKDGSPAADLGGRMVTFQPVDDIKVLPQGEIKGDGTFQLRTFRPGDGAPAGKYRVSIGPDQSVLPDEKGKPPAIARSYHDPKTSGLEVTLEPKSNEVTLTVLRTKEKR